jgi:SAM-dependent methyltransferase
LELLLSSDGVREPSTISVLSDADGASNWLQRWSHLIAPGGSVLDIACGSGRHMKFLAEQGHPVTGVDRSRVAIESAARFGEALTADLENDPWPLMNGTQLRQFDAVIVFNYLWRPLLALIGQSLAPGGVLIYETFAQGNETLGKPSRPDFLLQPNELLGAFGKLHLIAFEQGFLGNPPRLVQRIVVARTDLLDKSSSPPRRFAL